MRLEHRVCIVTGGGSGIGRATSLLFADEGARLVVADKRAASAQAVVTECIAKGAQAIAVEAKKYEIARMHIYALTLLEPDRPQHAKRLEAIDKLIANQK